MNQRSSSVNNFKISEIEQARIDKQEHFRRISNIPRRFAQASFDNYQIYQSTQNDLLHLLRRYAAQFPNRLKDGGGLMFFGSNGTGNTHLACALCNELINYNYHVVYTAAAQIFRRIKQTYAQSSGENERTAIAYYTIPYFLVIDEVNQGYGRDGNLTPFDQSLLFEIVNYRYENYKPMLVISNAEQNSLANIIGESSFDRLCENSAVLGFQWESYRKLTRHE